jgi:phage tail-like protein
MADIDYPSPAFYFKVVFSGNDNKTDSSFQDISGIGAKIETEAYSELGENNFVFQLPKPPTYTNLVLKRGITDLSSPLATWCRSIFESDLGAPIEPKEMMVYLMNENGEPMRSWTFVNAFPVSWEVENFNSIKNEIAIEKIEFRYSKFNREL